MILAKNSLKFFAVSLNPLISFQLIIDILDKHMLISVFAKIYVFTRIHHENCVVEMAKRSISICGKYLTLLPVNMSLCYNYQALLLHTLDISKQIKVTAFS